MMIKKIVQSLSPKPFYSQLRMTVANPVILKHWELNGRTIPPPDVLKETVIQAYQQRFLLNMLIETGTYKGTMVEAQKDFFQKIVSIEPNPQLCQAARKKFKKYAHVEIIEGGYAEVISTLIPVLEKSALFWLDACYSSQTNTENGGEYLIYKELYPILKSKFHHIVLIDNARHFVGQGDYPTLLALESFVKQTRPSCRMEVKDDLIRLTPPTT